MVVSSPFWDTHGSEPVFISRKQPVPYVFFAIPLSKQVWPNSAACWSPGDPGDGNLYAADVIGAVNLAAGRQTFGSMDLGICSLSRILSSQHSLWMSNSIVREALV